MDRLNRIGKDESLGLSYVICAISVLGFVPAGAHNFTGKQRLTGYLHHLYYRMMVT